MALVKDSSGRLHIETRLMAESLMDKSLLESTETERVFRPIPDLNVIKLGGQSIIDRGKQAVLPLLEEIAAARSKYQMLVMTGGKERTEREYAELLASAGLRLRRIIPTESLISIIEADRA